MKKIFIGVFMVVLMIGMFMLFTIKDKQQEEQAVFTVNSIEEVIEGIMKEQEIPKEAIIYTVDFEDGKLIFFSKYDGVSKIYAKKTGDKWMWRDRSAYMRFESESKDWYMATCQELIEIKDKMYYLAVGKIFNNNIKRLSLNKDDKEAKIVEFEDNIFWFAILDDKDEFNDIKVYDENNNRITSK